VGVGLGNMVIHRILFSNRPSFASPRSIRSVLTKEERQKRLDDRKDPVIIDDRKDPVIIDDRKDPVIMADGQTDTSDKHTVRKFITCCKAKLTVRRVYKCRLSFFALLDVCENPIPASPHNLHSGHDKGGRGDMLKPNPLIIAD